MKSLVIVLALSLFTADAAAQCPTAGIGTTAYGTGVGVCSNAILRADFDDGDCSLAFSYEPDPFWCGNTCLTQHLLIVGVASIPGGVPVGDPFLPGSRLYVLPLAVFGPFPGRVSEFTLSGAPALTCITSEFQTAPTWITTVSFPIEPETGLSSALSLTFL